DPGSSLNLMTTRTLKTLSLSVKHLNRERISIRGFNSSVQMSLGTITLPVCIGLLDSKAKFHVIDVDTSYKVLLGRPWLHRYEIIPSTLHQCIKFKLNDQEHTEYGDKHPFKSYESHYADAVFFMDKNAKKKSSKLEKPARNPLIPHFGSGSEDEESPKVSKAKPKQRHLGRSSSSSDFSIRFVGMVTHQTEDTLAVILTPRHLHKIMAALNLNSVGELKTFCVPARESDQYDIIFYSNGYIEGKTAEDDLPLIPYPEEEGHRNIPVVLTWSPQLEKAFIKTRFPRKWLKSHLRCDDLWRISKIDDGDQAHLNQGLGYKTQIHSCLMVEITAVDVEDEDEG
ncbi:retropepsin-like aspartic protease, partial [Serratia marcescens]|nr:retropepsin-like domain-containing protein [Serratia marcescens]